MGEARSNHLGRQRFFPAAGGAVNAAGAQSIKSGSVNAGFTAGYNWQAPNSPWVVGAEADIQSIRLSGGTQSGSIVYPGFAPTTFNIGSAASANWLATVRPRLGWARDNWLFYVTGGLALTQVNGQFAFADTVGFGVNKSAARQ